MKQKIDFDYSSWLSKKKFREVIFSELAKKRRTIKSRWKIHGDHTYFTEINPWVTKMQNSELAKQIVAENGWCEIESNDKKMWQILRWIQRNKRYKGDNGEYWMTIDESLISTEGDCEDYAIALLVLGVIAGVPKDRIDLVWGKVIGGGHCYVTYFREKDAKEVVLDWCYWFTPIVIKLRKWFGLEKNYKGIWGRAWIN